jgi:hypothetical protein
LTWSGARSAELAAGGSFEFAMYVAPYSPKKLCTFFDEALQRGDDPYDVRFALYLSV